MEQVIYERKNDDTVTKLTGTEAGGLLIEQLNPATGFTHEITLTPNELLRFISDAPTVSQANTPELNI